MEDSGGEGEKGRDHQSPTTPFPLLIVKKWTLQLVLPSPAMKHPPKSNEMAMKGPLTDNEWSMAGVNTSYALNLLPPKQSNTCLL